MSLLQLQKPNNDDQPDTTSTSFSNGESATPRFSEEFDSTCSTPYVSAPSSPGRGGSTGITNATGYFFSAPASPMHFVLSSAPSTTCPPSEPASLSDTTSFEFEFSSRFSSNGVLPVGSMSSADELFLNGHIRPMKLSSHLQRPQNLAPLLDLDGEEDDNEITQEPVFRGRDLKLRSRSLHRKARSLSPLRDTEFQWREEDHNSERVENENESNLELQGFESKQGQNEVLSSETTPSCSTSSSRSSSTGRNSKKWIFLKDLLYRSKSEGRANAKDKFWTSISFSPSKEKKLGSNSLSLSRDDKSSPSASTSATTKLEKQKQKQKEKEKQKKKSSEASKKATGKPVNGVGKRRVPPSPHELHYKVNRAHAEELKKRTFLPYRQGLFGCLGFSSKGYGALNGLAKTLNPVSSR